MKKNLYVKKIIMELNEYFSDEISKGKDVFIEQQSFKFRPPYGGHKFYLDWVDGSYESSLQNLIHHMLWEESYYEYLMNSRQLAIIEKIVEEEPNGIWGANEWDESLSDEEWKEDEKTQELLDEIYFEVIKNVGGLLKEFDFFDPDDFINTGHLES
jgi:hypothetical protein